jgi:sugar phosphate isomerase/epimerase
MENFKIGLQLYSVRDEMEKDVYATLKKVKEIGYDYVEFAGFYNVEPEKLKEMLDEIGLTAVGIHQNIQGFFENPELIIKYLTTLGIKNATIPWMKKDNLLVENKEVFESTIADIKKMSDMLKEYDISLAYHNHEFEFESTNGKYILDNLYETLGEDVLKTQLDLCWVKYGGEDPVKYIHKYSKRCPTVHFKDFTCKTFNAGAAYALIDNDGKAKNQREVDQFKFKPIGDGLQEFGPIVEAVKNSVAEYAIVEQDGGFEELSSIDSVAKSRKYLKETFGL